MHATATCTCSEVGPDRKPFVLSPSTIFSNKHGRVPSSVRCVSVVDVEVHPLLCAVCLCLKLPVLKLDDAYATYVFVWIDACPICTGGVIYLVGILTTMTSENRKTCGMPRALRCLMSMTTTT